MHYLPEKKKHDSNIHLSPKTVLAPNGTRPSPDSSKVVAPVWHIGTGWGPDGTTGCLCSRNCGRLTSKVKVKAVARKERLCIL